MMSDAELRMAILEFLSQRRTIHDPDVGDIQNFIRKFQASVQQDRPPDPHRVMSATWDLIGQGLVYFDFTRADAIVAWRLRPSDAGKAAAQDQEDNADRPDYIDRLQKKVPDISPAVLQYAEEAARAYRSRCYFASVVMVGVASEAAFLEMASAFCDWLPPDQGAKFRQVIDSPKNHYIHKFLEFRKKVEPLKRDLPRELADNMILRLDGVLDLLRADRNDAAHPTGKAFDREDAFMSLGLFVPCMQTVYGMKNHFQANPGRVILKG